MKAFFITGTDTGVGKTTVACALLAAGRARGLRVLGMKPIETGCVAGPDGIPRALDAIALERAARGEDLHDRDGNRPAAPTARGASRAAALYNIYRFAEPLAPSVAAELEGAAVALAPILRGVDRLRSLAPDLLLVEGAGGLLVPLTTSIDMADLAAALAIPLIVVARDGLGTINHTLLTLEAAAVRGLEVAAVVLSGATTGTSDRDAARNAEEIARRGRVPVIGRLPHLATPSLAMRSRSDPMMASSRASSTPEAAARAHTLAGAARASSTAGGAAPVPPDLARADSAHAGSSPAASSLDEQAAPSLVELAAAAEAHLDLSVLLPDDAP